MAKKPDKITNKNYDVPFSEGFEGNVVKVKHFNNLIDQLDVVEQQVVARSTVLLIDYNDLVWSTGSYLGQTAAVAMLYLPDIINEKLLNEGVLVVEARTNVVWNPLPFIWFDTGLTTLMNITFTYGGGLLNIYSFDNSGYVEPSGVNMLKVSAIK